MADGKPNFTGLWQALGTADWDIQDHSAQPGPFFQMGAIGAIPPGQGIVEGGEIPYKPAALEQKKKNFANRFKDDPEVKCYMPGVPRAAYLPYPFQIIQSQKDILFAYEYATTNRLINMGKPQEAATDTWMGTSNGHWEKDTLGGGCHRVQWKRLVRSRGRLRQRQPARGGALLAAGREYDELRSDHRRSGDVHAAVEDQRVLYRHREKDARLLEFKCVEFAEQLLYGDLVRKP